MMQNDSRNPVNQVHRIRISVVKNANASDTLLIQACPVGKSAAAERILCIKGQPAAPAPREGWPW